MNNNFYEGENMAEYHVGCGAFGIYAGTLNKKKDMWQNKTECTDEATSAVAQYFLEHGKHMKFSYKGEKYILKVEKLVEVE